MRRRYLFSWVAGDISLVSFVNVTNVEVIWEWEQEVPYTKWEYLIDHLLAGRTWLFGAA